MRKENNDLGPYSFIIKDLCVLIGWCSELTWGVVCGGRIHSLLDVFVNRVPCWIDAQYAGDVDMGDFSSVSQFTPINISRH